MTRCVARFGSGAVVVLAVSLPVCWASADDHWLVGNGLWSVASNWDAPPSAGPNVYIYDANGVSRTVTYEYAGAVVTFNSLTVELTGGGCSATNTLSMSANTLKSTSETIGQFGVGNFSQSGGTNSAYAGGLTIGEHSGAAGTYTLSGTGSLSSDAEGEWIGVSGTID